MTKDEYERVLTLALEEALEIVKTNAPFRTGNLKNAIRLERTAEGFAIIVDTTQAPYMPYTNEPWISPRWNGRANPNEAWFDMAADLVARFLAYRLGSALQKRD